MSTWWSIVARTDLGLKPGDLGDRSFAITNRGWYMLRDFLKAVNAQELDVLAQPEAFISSRLCVHWGHCLDDLSSGRWWLIGRWNGQSVVPAGLVRTTDLGTLGLRDEITNIEGTPTYMWLLTMGQELSTAPSGYLMTGKPRKGNPMSVTLSKGDKFNLGKPEDGGLTKVRIALGWDARQGEGDAYDLDASLVSLTDSGVSHNEDGFVYFNHPNGYGGAIAHQGDELTGATAGDDETIIVNLAALPAEVVDLRVYVTIFEAHKRKGQTFSQVDNAFVRIVDESTGVEVCRFDLTEDTASGVNALEFGKLYKHDGSWHFKAIGEGHTDEIDGIVTRYKIGA